MFCKYDSAVEDLFNCTQSCSEACSTLLGWLVKLMVLQSWHCLRLPFFGRGITSDFVHSVSHFSVPKSSDIDLLVFLLFLPTSTQLLISSEGMSSIPGHLPVFALLLLPLHLSTGGLSSLSVEDWLVCSMEPSVSSSQLFTSPQYHAHLLSTPTLSVISLLYLYLCWLVLLRSFSVSYASLLFPAFIPLSMASHRSSSQLSLVDLIFFLTSLCNVGRPYCSLLRHNIMSLFEKCGVKINLIWVSHPFILVSRRIGPTSRSQSKSGVSPFTPLYLFNCYK